ncbi:cell division protein ZapA [Pelovirga terrestris]|uniref:Cell division protein ZapA n=1 Tax=Pelovirga terrestris TaxID=2771352 RepID=A0A8J6UIQ0_9BACT|nr:cell division protein ZapA [Pelovirga terrestris]MBD1401445.1 cell division protein ZapA [Pelovirga terrestris]
MSAQIQIRIQGRIYTLRSHQSEEQVQKVVAFAEKKLAETAAGRSVDTVDLMILTLLNLAGEYLLLQEKKEQDDHEIVRRLGQLQGQLTLEIDDNFGC